MVVPCIVLGEQVSAKVVRWVAPHGMDVVGVVLCVVVLDEKTRRLEPVVVALARLDAACPSKVDPTQSLLHQPPRLDLGDFVGHAVDVLSDQCREHLALGSGHRRRAQTSRMQFVLYVRIVGGQDVVRRSMRDDGGGPLSLVQVVHELTGQVFHAGEGAEHAYPD
jgi:hypothetical protein